MFFLNLRCHSYIGDNVTAAELKKDIYYLDAIFYSAKTDLFRFHSSCKKTLEMQKLKCFESEFPSPLLAFSF